jgi:hypothetical protein
MNQTEMLHSSDTDFTSVMQGASYPGIEELLTCWKHKPDALIEILHAAQQQYGCLERDLLRLIAIRLTLPPSLVYGVASFYHWMNTSLLRFSAEYPACITHCAERTALTSRYHGRCLYFRMST